MAEQRDAIIVMAIHPVPERRQAAKFQVVGDQGGLAGAAGSGDPDQRALQATVKQGMKTLTGVDLLKVRTACFEARKISHS